MKVALEVELSNEFLSDLICAALEAGSVHWIRKALPLDWERPEGSRLAWYSDKAFFERPNFAFRVWHTPADEFSWDEETEEEGLKAPSQTLERDVSAADIQAGLKRMILTAPEEFSDLMAARRTYERSGSAAFYGRHSNGLAPVGDRLLQFTILEHPLDY